MLEKFIRTNTMGRENFMDVIFNFRALGKKVTLGGLVSIMGIMVLLKEELICHS